MIAPEDLAEGPARDLWAAAAVRERFRSQELLTRWLAAHEDADPEARLEAMETALALEEAASPAAGADGQPALRLPTGVRYQALREIGAEAARAALASLPPEQVTGAEALLRTLLDTGEAPPAESRDELTALATIGDWAGAAGAPLGFDPKEIDARIAKIDFTTALGGPDLERFVGREEELATLHRLWREPWNGPVLIEALGGMGKSLLVSKFVTEVLAGDEPPDAVLHFDFDRRDMQQAGLPTFFVEVVSQARRWLPPEAGKVLDDIRLSLGTVNVRESSGSSRNLTQAGSDPLFWMRRLRELFGKEGPRLVLFMDSFEQVIGFNDVAVEAARGLTQVLRVAGFEVFDIFASRFFGDAFLRESQFRHRLPMEEFSLEIAQLYVRREADRLGLKVGGKQIDEVIGAVGCSPLALRLAVAIVEKDKGKIDPDAWGRTAANSPERAQAFLYDRLLLRLKDENLRKIAFPGLLVRRLTVEVIAQVLAKPCGIDPALAPKLLEAAEKEGQLFKVDPEDPGALWHRQDIRSLMLPDLDRQVGAEMAKAINEAAVNFYAKQDGLIARTEEYYHRLRLNRDVVDLPTTKAAFDQTVDLAAVERLKNAEPELPPEGRARLRMRLRAGSFRKEVFDAQMAAMDEGRRQAEAGDKPNLGELRAIIERELQSGAPREATLEHLRGAGENRLEGELGDVYAETLMAQGCADQLIDEGLRLPLKLEANAPLPLRQARVGVLCTLAAAKEGKGRIEDAKRGWQAAREAATAETDPYRALSAEIGWLRCVRKGRGGSLLSFAGQYVTFVGLTPRLLKVMRRAEGLEALRERPVAAREFLAEVSDLLLRTTPVDMSGLRRQLAWLIESGEAFPSVALSTDRLEPVCLALFGETVSSTSELISRALRLPQTRGDSLKLVKVLRDEVDWTLAFAANRKPPQAGTGDGGPVSA